VPETDIIVAAMHGHVIALDNVSTLSGEMSDALCRAATGGGMSARAAQRGTGRGSRGGAPLAMASNHHNDASR
jgi:hypothetical protein